MYLKRQVCRRIFIQNRKITFRQGQSKHEKYKFKKKKRKLTLFFKKSFLSREKRAIPFGKLKEKSFELLLKLYFFLNVPDIININYASMLLAITILLNLQL